RLRAHFLSSSPAFTLHEDRFLHLSRWPFLGLFGRWARRARLTSAAENGARAKWQSGEMLRFATPSTLVRIQPSPPPFFLALHCARVVFARASDRVPLGGA